MPRVDFRVGALACAIGLFSALPARAQVSGGEVFGRVTDASGAVLPAATVSLIGPSLIQPLTAKTEASGAYRFPHIPIGTYVVTFELVGFTKLVRSDIIIAAGFDAEINATLELSSVQETITVTGNSPIVNTRSTTVATGWSKAELDKIPTARDPWAVFALMPGMTMSGANVGGSLSGQQAQFNVFGAGSNQQWNMDGATIGDYASSGASPTYYDFDAFEEIHVTTAGADASQQGGGVQINLITKSGGNTYSGSGRYFDANQRFLAQNVTDAQRTLGAGAGNTIQDVFEAGAQLGGPIAKDRMWFWGAASRQNVTIGLANFYDAGKSGCADVAATPGNFSLDQLRDCQKGDVTTLRDYNGKLQYQEARGHQSTFGFAYNEKYKGARGVGQFSTPITGGVQRGPSIFSRVDHRWIVSNNLTIIGQYQHVHSDWGFFFLNDNLANVQAINYVDTKYFDRSRSEYHTIRPQDEVRADGNYFASKVLGADHSLKFGFEYRRSPVESTSVVGGGAVARYRGFYVGTTGQYDTSVSNPYLNKRACVVNGVSHAANTADGCDEAAITRNGDFAYAFYHRNAYINDSIKKGRVTINLGLRFDHQHDLARPASTQANAILPDLLPGIQFAGADSGARYNNWSPRAGITYDLLGRGHTVLKASAARYWGLGMYTANTLQPTGTTTLRYAWYDLNGDKSVQANELDLSKTIATPSANYNASNPSAVITPATVDPTLQNDITDEVLVGIDHEVMANFAVGVMFISRTYHQLQGQYRTQDFSADYTLAPAFTAACGNGVNGTPTCDQASYTGDYYQRTTALHAATILRNDTRYNVYQGVEITARKRLSHRWSMSSSYVYNHLRHFEPSPDKDYLDPTNHGPVDLISGYESGSLNGPHMFNLSGMYQFPWDITVSGGIGVTSPAPFNPFILSPVRTGTNDQVQVLIYPTNTQHYPGGALAALHMDKELRLGGRRRVLFNVDVFNLGNISTVTGTILRQNTSKANTITGVVGAREARIGIRVNF